MKSWYCNLNLWTVIIFFVLAPMKCCWGDSTSKSNATITALQTSIKSRLLERRHLNTIIGSKNKNRKMIEVSDPSSGMDGQYIIIFDPESVSNVTEKSMQMFTASQITYVFDNIAIKGVAIRNVTPLRLNELETDSHILSMEPEIMMRYDTNDIQYNATYNLDRLDDKMLPLNGIYKRRGNGGGKGVTVFVLDSGIRSSHVEFDQNRATCGFDAVLGYESDIPCEDLHGHGTHVAGLIGGKTVGVANQVNIVSVKVAPREFTFEGGAVLYGIQYVLLEKLRHPTKPMVVNMSFGGDRFLLLDFMVEALLTVGVTVVTSAGNGGVNACFQSPAGGTGVLTVGASDIADVVPWWSNFGPCVDVFAPGINIISAGKRNDTQYVMGSGTSQSAPMVAGAAALYLQIQPTLTPEQVFRLIVLDSLKNVLTSGRPEYVRNETSTLVPISKNRLLQTGIFTDARPQRSNPTCPYTGRKLQMCYTEGWWVK